MAALRNFLKLETLNTWKETLGELPDWMFSVYVFLLILLAGIAFLALFWGLHMNALSGFFLGAALAAHIALMALIPKVTDPTKIEAYRDVLIAVVISAVAGAVLFRLLPRIVKALLGALLGAAPIAVIVGYFVKYKKIPYLPEHLKLSQERFIIALFGILAAVGFLLQFLAWRRLRKKEKEQAETERLQAEEAARREEEKKLREQQEAEDALRREAEEMESGQTTIADAQTILVEKAKELAQAATKAAEKARRSDRYQDVADGLYSASVAASKLGISEELFLQGMKAAGFDTGKDGDAAAESGEEEAAAGENAADDAGAAAENAEKTAAVEGSDGAKARTEKAQGSE